MQLYHALNRGVEKRSIFMDSGDYARFVHDLYEFNDTQLAPAFERRSNAERLRDMDVGFTKPYIRTKIVEIHGWCLMNNHYHLLLSELAEGGVSLFLRKLNIGYANYFNLRHKRSGVLFQGRTKKVPIETEAHFQHILHYIHLNPLDHLDGAKNWRKWKLESAAKALKHLGDYKWSSYNDYCGRKNFPSVISPELFKKVYGDYQRVMEKYLADSQKEFEERMSLTPLYLE